MFFQGSLQDAITEAVTQQKRVLCFVTNDNEESQRWEDEYLGHRCMQELVEPRAVALRLTEGSEEAGYLAKLLPLPKAPVVLIMKQGEFKEYIVSGTSGHDFYCRMRKAFDATAPNMRRVAILSTISFCNECAPPPVIVVRYSDEPIERFQLGPASRELQNQRLANEQLANEAAVNEPSDNEPLDNEPSEIGSFYNEPSGNDSRQRAGLFRVPEGERRIRAQVNGHYFRVGMPANEGHRREREEDEADDRIIEEIHETRSRIVEEVNEANDRMTEEDNAHSRVMEEEREAREARARGRAEERQRILERIENDKAERRMQAEMRRQQRIDEQRTPGTKLPSTSKRFEMASIQVRLFDGSTIRSQFEATSLLKDVRQWVDEKRGESTAPYTFKQILSPLPHKNIDETEERKTLGELGLIPSATLVLIPVQKYTSAYQGPPQAPLSRFISMILGFFTWLLSLVGLAGGNRNGARQESATGGANNDTSAASSQGINRRIQGFQNPGDQHRGNLYNNGNSLNFEPRPDNDDNDE